ncbi:MAG: 2-oxoacid:acceptor oxidoreductase family protein [Candidatus Omnitrophica bacterium]|nr:2-oxoacid:acceptor oxidoreductase family protein [Candidatus Omnitrophota bacterium]
MIEQMIIAGAGGQGIMLVGKVLAESAMRENKFTTWLPSYGAEVRGGSAFCMVSISDEEIPSPYVEEIDTLIVFNQISLKRFISFLKLQGLLILNSSLVSSNINKKKSKIISFPFTEIAIKLGDIRIANMVALGVYLKQKNILKPETVFKTLREIISADKKSLLEINLKAVKEGMRIG